jgi:beta-lactamase superfamily II metal-dependent hydrolase
LQAGHLRGPYDLLLFPHHGSHTPWLGKILAETQPTEIWISSGERPAVARELDRRGLEWSSTAEAGPLSRRFPGGGMDPAMDRAVEARH